jgi:hypothetical protein
MYNSSFVHMRGYQLRGAEVWMDAYILRNNEGCLLKHGELGDCDELQRNQSAEVECR